MRKEDNHDKEFTEEEEYRDIDFSEDDEDGFSADDDSDFDDESDYESDDAEPDSEGTDDESGFWDNLMEWKERETKQRKLVMTTKLVALAGAIAILAFLVRDSEKYKNASETKTGHTAVITETNASTEKEAADKKLPINETEPTLDVEQIRSEAAGEATEKYHDTVFGVRTGGGHSPIKVDGFSDREKRLIHYNEADFVSDVGEFLMEQKLSTPRIIVEKELGCSSDNAMSFEARLQGLDQYRLDMVFYPDLPGEYIFLLQKADKDELTPAATQSTEASVQQTTPETNAPVTTVQAEQTPATTQTESGYDATSLSLKGIPSTLVNYLANKYELQFKLYDYLYVHGKKNVSSATVKDFTVDETKQAVTIHFTLSDGSLITGTYDHGTNTYSFE